MMWPNGRLSLLEVVLCLVLLMFCGCEQPRTHTKTAQPIRQWPPRLYYPYPDVSYVDQDGYERRLSEFAGEVLLVEMTGMNCPACQAFSGAYEVGAFGGIRPQKNLVSIKKIFRRYAHGMPLNKVVFVQILLYSMSMKAPTPLDGRRWAKHFRLKTENREFVLVPKESLVSPESFKLVPGFQLIDRNFVLRWDSTGHTPKHNLFRQLLPHVPQLIDEPNTIRDIQHAYEALFRRHTSYDYYASTMGAQGSLVLYKIFRLIDKAVVAKAQTLEWLQSAKKQGMPLVQYVEVMESVRNRLGSLKVPEQLKGFHSKLLLVCIDDELYMKKLAQQTREKQSVGGQIDEDDARVRASHRGIVLAYEALLKALPKESQQNQDAFFDHLDALDFLNLQRIDG